MPRLSPLRVLVGATVAGVLVLVAGGLVLVLAALFGSSSPHFGRSDLIGVYVANYPTGTETLTLNEDGTFLQEVTMKEPPESAPVTRTGTWKWDDSSQYLDIADCMGVNDGFGGISSSFQTDSGCAFPLSRKWWFFGRLYVGDRASAPLWKIH